VSTRCRLGLLILTTVGALALLVAFGIVLLMRLNKNRFTTKRRYSRNWPSESSSQNSYGAAMGSSVYESAYGNPFLTESEKDFVAQLETTIDKHDVSISGNTLVLLPHTSTDFLPCSEREAMHSIAQEHIIYLHSQIVKFDTIQARRPGPSR
jgi:hypothetical protein